MENKTKYLRTRVTEKFFKDFFTHCKKNKYNPSQRLRIIIEKEIKGEIK